jgi:hypothetical protein
MIVVLDIIHRLSFSNTTFRKLDLLLSSGRRRGRRLLFSWTLRTQQVSKAVEVCLDFLKVKKNEEDFVERPVQNNIELKG